MNKSKNEILLDARISYKFYFNSDRDGYDIALMLSSVLNSQVFWNSAECYDTNQKYNIEPSTLIKNVEYGENNYILTLPNMNYTDAIMSMKRVFGVIDDIGNTTDKDSCYFRLSFADGGVNLNNIDVCTFASVFKEEQYSFTKNSKMYRIVPMSYDIRNRYMMSDSADVFAIFNSCKTSNTNCANYAVNFVNLYDGYLELKYIGNKDYQKKFDEARLLIENACVSAYTAIFDNVNKDDINYYNMVKDEIVTYTKEYATYSVWHGIHPDIDFTVDMSHMDSYISNFWPVIRDRVYSICLNLGLTKCKMNYDSDKSMFQFKDTKFENIVFIGKESIDFVDCELSGLIDYAQLYHCKIKDALVTTGRVFSCHVEGSVLRDCFIDSRCDLWDSVSNGRISVSNGTYSNCYIYGSKTDRSLTRLIGTKVVKTTSDVNYNRL